MEFNVFTIGFIVSFKSNLGPEWRTIINPHLRTYFVHENPEVTVAKSCSHFFLSFSAKTSPPPQTTLYMYIILHRRRSHQMILPATFAYMHTYITRTRVYFKRATHRQTPTRVHVCARPLFGNFDVKIKRYPAPARVYSPGAIWRTRNAPCVLPSHVFGAH